VEEDAAKPPAERITAEGTRQGVPPTVRFPYP